MSYGLLGLKQQFEGEALQGLSGLSQQQAQMKASNDQIKNAQRQDRNNAIGMGAGIGMAFGPMGALAGAGIGYLASSLF